MNNMTYMLDTNTCIFLMKKMTNPLSAFAARRDKGMAISALTLAELEFGVYNSAAIQKNRETLFTFLTLVTILHFDTSAALEYGDICATLRKDGTPIGTIDMLIAAHARSAELVLVTNNTREFSRVTGLKLEDWY